MRLVVALVLLAGCPSDDGPAFTVAEPAAGAVFDRCHLRARTSVPDGLEGSGIEEGGDDDVHVDWRLDGGAAHQVEYASVLTDQRERLVFALDVPEGSHRLELGTCDTFDRCDWSAGPSLTVANAVGAPDCRSWGLGHHVFPSDTGGALRAILPDDKQLLFRWKDGAGQLTRLAADGSIDTSFAGAGRLDGLPLIVGEVIPTGDGGLLLTGPGALARITPEGAFDTSFGTYENVQGLRPQPCPDAHDCTWRALQPDGAGGYWVAGGLGVDGQPGMFTPFVMHLDAALAVTEHAVLDPTLTSDTYRLGFASIDGAGHAVIFVDDIAIAGSIAGLDASWGTGGRFVLPTRSASVPSVVAEGTRVAIARTFVTGTDSALELFLLEGGVARPTITVATGPDTEVHPVALQIDAAGRVYAATTRATPNPPFVFDPGPSNEVIVARFAGGALDAGWGDAGIARFDSSDVVFPVAVDPNHELLTGFLLDADGAPWLSTETSSGTQGFSTQRRGSAIVKLRVD